ncbi:MAG: hypothetical protein O7G86_12585 [Gammaproteobacteria bacterium]|nr:hypothetical protein [Gammaproteobacteria bacterium]MCZ6854746.1 hypothetical protein [Gammaproteobacteria bacterium]
MRACVGILIVVVLSGCDPLGPLPGGALTGEAKTPPDDWALLAEIETIQLETNPDDPYSVNLWVVSVESRLYIAAGGGETKWSAHFSTDPNVRLRIDPNIYELRATPVDNHKELDEVRQAYVDKYAMKSDSPQFDDSTVFRLDRRL